MDVRAPQENQAVISSTTGAKLNISEVESVANSWIIDFSFLSLCRYYREQNTEKFSKTLKVFEGKLKCLASVVQLLYESSFFRLLLLRCNWAGTLLFFAKIGGFEVCRNS